MKHTVVAGETLWSIAEKYLGDPFKWPLLYRLNHQTIIKAQQLPGRRKFRGPDWIYPGTVLKVQL